MLSLLEAILKSAPKLFWFMLGLSAVILTSGMAYSYYTRGYATMEVMVQLRQVESKIEDIHRTAKYNQKAISRLETDWRRNIPFNHPPIDIKVDSGQEFEPVRRPAGKTWSWRFEGFDDFLDFLF